MGVFHPVSTRGCGYGGRPPRPYNVHGHTVPYYTYPFSGRSLKTQLAGMGLLWYGMVWLGKLASYDGLLIPPERPLTYEGIDYDRIYSPLR